MAQRRCIAQKIVESARFYELSKASQCLYLHLLANCDDDGIVEGKLIMRLGQFKGRDLQALIDAEFVAEIIPEKRIVYLIDFAEFNTLKTDRSAPSIYRQHLIDVFPALKNRLFTPKNNAFGRQNDSANKSKSDESNGNESKLSQDKSEDSKSDQSNSNEEKSGQSSLNPDNADDDTTTDTDTTTSFSSFKQQTGNSSTGFDYHCFGTTNHEPTYEHMIPTLFPELVVDYIKLRGWSYDDASRIADRFMKINSGNNWECLNRVTWTTQLDGFLRNEKSERLFIPEDKVSEQLLDSCVRSYETSNGKLDSVRREMIRYFLAKANEKFWISAQAQIGIDKKHNILVIRNFEGDRGHPVDYYSNGTLKNKETAQPQKTEEPYQIGTGTSLIDGEAEEIDLPFAEPEEEALPFE